MIKVTQERNNIFTVELGVPELHILEQVRLGFCIPRTQALASCINKGLDTTVIILEEIASYEQRKREVGDFGDG